MDRLLKQLLNDATDLPSLPTAAMQIIKMAQNPEAGVKDVSEVVNRDPALAVKLLRVANSPLYARSGAVSTLDKAIFVLGLNATVMLALSFSLVSSSDESGNLNYSFFWKRSILAATAGRILAKKLGLKSSDDVFLASLLQFIGKLALAKLKNKDIDGLNLAEVDYLSATHWMLTNWSFPESITGAIVNSRCPEKAGGEDEKNMARCIRASQLIADSFIVSLKNNAAGENRYVRAISLYCERELGCSKEFTCEVFDEFAANMPEVESWFSMKIASKGELSRLANSAKDIMMIRGLHSLHELEASRQDFAEESKRAKELEVQSTTDALTGAKNRRYFDDALVESFNSSLLSNRPLSVIFIDLDRFKSLNDTYGHHVGDLALRFSARIIEKCLKGVGVLARYGGEEFVLLLPDQSVNQGIAVGQRIVRALNANVMRADGQKINITASLGLATMDKLIRFDSADELKNYADRAMYQAKQTGRNKLVVSERNLLGAA